MGEEAVSDTNQRWSLADAGAAAFATSALLITCDFIKALRSSDWAPLEKTEWLGLGAAAATLFAVAALLAVILYVLARLLHRDRLAALSSHGILPITVAAYVGTGYSVSLPFSRTYLIALASLTGLWILHRALAARRALTHPATVSHLWAWAAVGACAGAWWLTVSTYDWPHRVIATMTGAFLGAMAMWSVVAFFASIPRCARLHSYRPLVAWAATAMITAAMLAGLGTVPYLQTPTNEEAQPIVLVTADAMRASTLGLYGGPALTPHLEEISQQNAAVFNRSYALAPWTLPSMFGLFASQIPPGLTPGAGPDAWQEEVTLYRFPKDATTLASLLRERGYATAAFVGNSLLRDPNGILRGFDTHTVVGHRTHSTVGPLHALPVLEAMCLRLGLPLVEKRPVDTTRILTAYAESFIRQHRGQSYFLWVHFMDPHTAYAPPSRFLSPNWTWPVYCNADPYWGTPLSDEHGNVSLTENERAEVYALYQGEVRYVDEAVGAIWAALTKAAVAETAFFCFTSDHGEELWDHGGYGHGQHVYDELVRVPLVIRGPGIVRQEFDLPVSAIDLMPTLASLAGLDAPAGWQGRTFADGLKGTEPVAPSPVFAQGTNAFSGAGPLQMVVEGQQKLIHATESDKYYLFDLTADPWEDRELLGGQEPPGPLRDKLRGRAALAPLPVRTLYDEQGGEGDAQDLDAQMRGMGYIR